jgi:hypothetical protein
MLTCLFKKDIDADYVISCIKMTPFDRLSMLADTVCDLSGIVQKIEEQYHWYLSLRQEEKLSWWEVPNTITLAMEKAEEFHKSVIHGLMKEISKTNPELLEKSDIY